MDPYDTHPPLKDRIEAVKSLPPGQVPEPDPFALELLDRVSDLEYELLAALGGPVAKLQPLSWEETAVKVYLPTWTKLVQNNANYLAGLTCEKMPNTVRDLKMFGHPLVDTAGRDLPDEQSESLACAVLGAALALLLFSRGWTLKSPPGEPVQLLDNDQLCEPFRVPSLLAKQELTQSAWLEQCNRWGIAGSELAPVKAQVSAVA